MYASNSIFVDTGQYALNYTNLIKVYFLPLSSSSYISFNLFPFAFLSMHFGQVSVFFFVSQDP